MSAPTRALARLSAAVASAKRPSKHAVSGPRPDLVPVAFLGMPVVAVGGACLEAGIGAWALIPVGFVVLLLIALVVWSTGGPS